MKFKTSQGVKNIPIVGGFFRFGSSEDFLSKRQKTTRVRICEEVDCGEIGGEEEGVGGGLTCNRIKIFMRFRGSFIFSASPDPEAGRRRTGRFNLTVAQSPIRRMCRVKM